MQTLIFIFTKGSNAQYANMYINLHLQVHTHFTCHCEAFITKRWKLSWQKHKFLQPKDIANYILSKGSPIQQKMSSKHNGLGGNFGECSSLPRAGKLFLRQKWIYLSLIPLTTNYTPRIHTHDKSCMKIASVTEIFFKIYLELLCFIALIIN